MGAGDPPIDPRGFGRRVREARAACGLSQLDLAKAVGSTKRTVENWESGTLPRSKLPALAEELGVTPMWLTTGRDTAATELAALRREQREGFAAVQATLSEVLAIVQELARKRS